MKYSMILLFALCLLTGCSLSQKAEYEPGKNDVVFELDQTVNKNKLRDFYSNVVLSKKDKVTLVNFTKEGDSVIRQLQYDGDYFIQVTEENTHSKHGKQKSKKYSCSSLSKTAGDRENYYFLSCDEHDSPVMLGIIK